MVVTCWASTYTICKTVAINNELLSNLCQCWNIKQQKSSMIKLKKLILLLKCLEWEVLGRILSHATSTKLTDCASIRSASTTLNNKYKNLVVFDNDYSNSVGLDNCISETCPSHRNIIIYALSQKEADHIVTVIVVISYSNLIVIILRMLLNYWSLFLAHTPLVSHLYCTDFVYSYILIFVCLYTNYSYVSSHATDPT